MKLTKATVEIEDPAPLFCSECGEKIYTCDDCSEYFELDPEEIYCCERGTMQSNAHYCETCGENYLEKI
jgi:predicted RNA-binding Zn-ribbon protein involved in translation (DUF1610 family)